MFIQTEFEIYNLNAFKTIYTSAYTQEGEKDQYLLVGDPLEGETEVFGVYVSADEALNALKKLGRDIKEGKDISIIIPKEEK